MRTRSSSEVEKSITPREPNPGSTIGATAATITAAAATRRAPRPAATSSRAARPGPVHTGPQPCTRRSPSANSSAVAAMRKSRPKTGRITSSSTESAKPTSATGGSRPSRGLPARNASEWAANTAAHTPASPASIRGASGGEGATCTRACSPTRAAASSAARRVSGVGRPNQVVSGNTSHPIAIARPTMLAIVASTRLRRSSSEAMTAEATPAASRRIVGPLPSKTRPSAMAAAAATSTVATPAIRRCVRADVPWVRAIVPSRGSWG